MKIFSGQKAGAPQALPLVLLLAFWWLPLSAAAQTEERIDTGRLGAEDAEPERIEEDNAAYYRHWLYLGGRFGPSLRFYTPSGDTAYTGGDALSPSADIALQFSLQVLPFLSVQGETVFTWDRAAVWAYRKSGIETDSYTQNYTGFSLQFPLVVKLHFYPGKFRVSPFFGAYYLVPLGELKNSNSLDNEERSFSYDISPPFGLLGGLNGAFKLGPGLIFAELRYASDLGEPEPGDGEIRAYRRSMVSLTLGYELGFFVKKGGINHE
jgi:hypothetical protein